MGVPNFLRYLQGPDPYADCKKETKLLCHTTDFATQTIDNRDETVTSLLSMLERSNAAAIALDLSSRLEMRVRARVHVHQEIISVPIDRLYLVHSTEGSSTVSLRSLTIPKYHFSLPIWNDYRQNTVQ